MAWSGGTYTKGNNGTGGWAGDAAAGIGIEAGRHDTQDNDFATGINQCLNKDGSNAATGNLNLGGFLPTNVGAGSAAAPAYCSGNDSNTGMYSGGTDIIAFSTNGAERARITATGRLGVGVTNPASNIHVVDSSQISSTTTIPTLTFNSSQAANNSPRINMSKWGASGSLPTPDGHTLGETLYTGLDTTSTFFSGAVIRAIIGTNAATSAPTYLSFSTNPGSSATISERLRINSDGQLQTGDGSAGTPVLGFLSDTDTGVFRPTTNTLAISTGGSERVRVDSGGKVAIGTTTTVDALTMATTGTNVAALQQFANDTNGSILRFRKSRNASIDGNTIVTSGDTIGQISFEGANGTGYDACAAIRGSSDGTPGATTDMPGRLTFFTAADGTATLTERMRITNAGRIGLGSNAPGSFVQITNNESNAINSLGIASNVAGDKTTHAVAITKKDSDNTTAQVYVAFSMNAGATASGQINANGASAAAFGSYSDERLKENIADLPNQLNNILALRPVEFDYKDGSGHQLGFIAQEVQSIFPDLVSEGANGYLVLSDMNKNDARLIKAFQELHAKVEALEARIVELEG